MGRDAGLGLFVLLVACGVAYGAQGKPADGRTDGMSWKGCL
jgi:hypothetical protein